MTIGDYVVVGIRSLVLKDVRSWTGVARDPAKFLKKRVLEEK